MNDTQAMERALHLALQGWGRVAPNPMVGAVLLNGGASVGEGAHREFGGPHAEIAALDQAREAAAGATCVVTLEPCTHHGKTPPCVDALIAAGVTRVIAAVRDPNREARGGMERLEAAGIEVALGLLARQAAALNAPFLCSHLQSDRPFVALKVATSLDGFLADDTGRSQWVSGVPARDYVHWLRAGFDAIAVGRRTVEVDDPELTVRGPLEPRVPPRRVVFSRSGTLARDRRLVRTAAAIPTVLLTAPEARSGAHARLRGTGVIVVGVEGLPQGLQALRREGVRSVLVEGGGEIAGALLEAGLVDRVYWIQAPMWLAAGTPAFGSPTPLSLGTTPRWTVTERRALGEDTLLVVDRQLCLPAS